ncbi:YgaP family membrane protein [Neobacillus sp. D3-1R]|uniref:YgaP family membrane protein n=1 Tax=Neobacillus sp. D3-1R TaxID=3445778 RepID=UPI003F9ED879
MNVKPNIGIINALIRITCGLTVLAWSTSKLVKHPWRDSYLFMALMGAMKVGEGILRYCPLTDVCERMQDKNDGDGNQNKTNNILPYNPS